MRSRLSLRLSPPHHSGQTANSGPPALAWKRTLPGPEKTCGAQRAGAEGEKRKSRQVTFSPAQYRDAP